MTNLTIRQVVKSDIGALEFLLNTLGYKISTEALEAQLQHYNQPSSIVFVAEHKETKGSHDIVGLISGHAIPLLHQLGFLGRITAMVVAENSRGNGVGVKLVGELEKWFADNQCIRYEVTSGDHRHSAHNFYEKLNYLPDERRFIKLP